MATPYIDPTLTAGRAFYQQTPDGPLVMLNLLRFRDVADYSAHPDLAPAAPISGQEAYHRYMEHTKPYLAEHGAELLYHGSSRDFLIGPTDETWDAVLLVRQTSKQAFLAFAQNEGYLRGIGHRMAALEDSRLLPTVPLGSTFIHQ